MSSSERGTNGQAHSPTNREAGTMTIHRRITRYIGATLMAAASITLGACDDGILDEDPPHIIVPENLYVDLAGFEAGINALYAQVRKEREGVRGDGSNELRAMIATVGVDNAFGNHRVRNGADLQ